MNRRLLILLLAAAVVTLTTSARAAAYYWDIDGANPGSGGATPSGTWSAGTTNLSIDASGRTDTSGSPITTTESDEINFSAGFDAIGDYTVTLSGTNSARWVRIEEGNLTLSGGTLALTNSTGSGGNYLFTIGSANFTLGSTAALYVTNGISGNNFINLNPAAEIVSISCRARR